MRISLHATTPSHQLTKTVLHLGWTGLINKIVWIHIALYAAYLLASVFVLLSPGLDEGIVSKFVRDYIALPGTVQERTLPWVVGVVTYQFAHRSLPELVVSMLVLLISGHLLKEHIGERRVIVLYMTSAVLAALIFLFAHLMFPVFSGHHTYMEGALPGALGVFTMVVALQGSGSIRIAGANIRIWALYVLVLVIAFTAFSQSSIASVLMYLAAIWAGLQYATMKLMRKANLGVSAGTGKPDVV